MLDLRRVDERVILAAEQGRHRRAMLAGIMAGVDLPSLLELLARPEWYADAACKGMDVSIFFPRRGQDPRPAQRVCAGCPVREQCLADALARGDKHGIYGGFSERQRRKLRSTKVGSPAA